MTNEQQNNPWDIRFSSKEYIYGVEPNQYLVEKLKIIPKGKALFAAEGEGRNAVFAAKLGWQVFAYDGSEVAQHKALQLAKYSSVSISYQVKTHDEFLAEYESFDLLVLIFAHTLNREKLHKNLLRYLKPGGILIMEGFSKEQINYVSGGPKALDLLFSEEEIKSDFDEMQELYVSKELVDLNEGNHHLGLASVIRAYGVK